MKCKSIWMLFCIICLYLIMPQQAYAQSGGTSANNKPAQDQIIREILNEVRQLRAEVQRLKRAQVATERLRLQQGQVARLTREIDEVREKISETQGRQIKMNGTLEETEKQVNSGLIGQSELKRINGEIEELKRREQRLIDQESQLSAELNVERARLTTLNKQLDELGQEAAGDEKK
jgi:predicted  nucleic acid-binding Zn-ribbon protein